jgi:hypothetical protein
MRHHSPWVQIFAFSLFCEKHQIDYIFFLVCTSKTLCKLHANPSSLWTSYFCTSLASKIPCPIHHLSLSSILNSRSFRVRLHTFLQRMFPFLMITVDPHGHLTCTYHLLLLLSQSASHKPHVPVTAPPFYRHVSHCWTFDNITMHRIAYVDLAQRTPLVREE